MIWFRPIALAIAILAGTGVSAFADKRVALVIGNSAYKNVARLQNPANDSAAVVDMFKRAGFDRVDARPDLNINDMRRALREFSYTTRDADVAVIYYAGHGMEMDGANYLIPVDAMLETDADVYDETLSLDRVLMSIEPAKRLRLVILDACRDNPFARTMKRANSSRSVGRGLAKVEPSSPNTMIAFAARAGSTAADGDGNNSPFASALVAHLPKPGLDLRKAFGFVRDDVLKATNNKQEPFTYGSLGGNDVALVPGVPVAADQDNSMRRDFEFALQASTRPVWDSFIGKYPSGFYTELAKAYRDKAEIAPIDAAGGTQAAAQADASEKARVAAEKEKLAALSPPDNKADQKADPDLPRRLQIELARVGCSTGAADGNWNTASQRALELFNRHAGTKLVATNASIDALDAIKARTARVCPLACAHGFKADGDRCTRIACRAGFELNDDNECERIKPKTQTSKPDKPRPKPELTERSKPEAPRPAAPRPEAPSPKQQASGQVFCDSQGCRPVQKGCRISAGKPIGTVARARAGTGGLIEVCD